MTLIKHELKQGQATLLIWTSVIGFMLAACILIYPEMGTQMSDVGSMFAEMGSFSAAFGMDGSSWYLRLSKRREGTDSGISAHPPNKPQKNSSTEACFRPAADYHSEYHRYRRYLHLHTRDRRRTRDTSASPPVPRLFYTSGGDCRYMLWNLRFHKPKRSGNRTRHSCALLFSEHHRQPDRGCKVLKIYYSLRLYGKRGYYRRQMSENRVPVRGPDIDRTGNRDRILQVLHQRYPFLVQRYIKAKPSIY